MNSRSSGWTLFFVPLIVALGLVLLLPGKSPSAAGPQIVLAEAATFPQLAAPTKPTREEKIRALFKRIHEQIEFFRRDRKAKVVPAIQVPIKQQFEIARRNLEAFLDWQYSLSTGLVSSVNSLRDGGNWVWEKSNALFGREVPITPNHNVEMTRQKFQETVMSENDLKLTIGAAGDAAGSDLRSSTIELMTQIDKDLSEVLNMDLQVKVPNSHLHAAFQEALQGVSQRLNPMSRLLVTFCALHVGEAVGGCAGSLVSTSLGVYLTAQWYANLALSGKLLVWAGVTTAPAAISAFGGAVGGAATMGVALVASWATNRLIDYWTRPQAREKLIELLNKLETGLLEGDAATEGLRPLTEKAIDELCDALEEAYRKAVLKIV